MASGLPRIYVYVTLYSSAVRTEAIAVCCYDIRNELKLVQVVPRWHVPGKVTPCPIVVLHLLGEVSNSERHEGKEVKAPIRDMKISDLFSVFCAERSGQTPYVGYKSSNSVGEHCGNDFTIAPWVASFESL